MNRFFDMEEWRRGFPRRAFARLDDIEPIAPRDDDDLTFVFDAVDADWEGFAAGGDFDLNAPSTGQRVEAQWRRRFAGGGDDDGPDIYEKVPVYRIEVCLPRGHRWFASLPRTEEPWVVLQLTDQETDTPVEVYGGLFAPPTGAFLHAAPQPNAPSAALNAIFDMKTWPDAAPAQLASALQARCDLEALVCFDIGQGLASALVCRCGMPIYYFDVGCGSGRNAPTAPPRVDFCTCDTPPIILSHWDTDHWAGAKKQPALHARTWIVPRQTISTTHTLLGNDILKAKGSILVVGHGAPPITWSGSAQDYDLRRCTGTGRNGSGLALVVTDHKTNRAWVLTGDAGYDLLAQPRPPDIAAMVAPHHGADMGPSSLPFSRSPQTYARLMYSFGPDNAHGPSKPPVRHPVAAAVSAHATALWSHGSWASPPATCLAGADVLATATHGATHLQGAGATWAGGTPSLGHLALCSNALPVSQW